MIMGKCRDENKEIVLQKTDHHFGTAVFGDAVQIIGVGFPNTSKFILLTGFAVAEIWNFGRLQVIVPG